MRTTAPLNLKETIDWTRQLPRSARVAQGYARISDFARSVQRRAKRTVLRKQHPDRLRRAILDTLERIVSDRDALRKAARRAARVKWRSQFHAV